MSQIRKQRGLFIQTTTPSVFQGFCVLTDVKEEKWTFSVIVGTHRSRYLRAKNVINNIINDRKITDLETYLPNKERLHFTGEKELQFFQLKLLFHRGNPKHSEKLDLCLFFTTHLESQGPF